MDIGTHYYGRGVRIDQPVRDAAEAFRAARAAYYGLDVDEVEHTDYEKARQAYVDAATAVAAMVLAEVDATR